MKHCVCNGREAADRKRQAKSRLCPVCMSCLSDWCLLTSETYLSLMLLHTLSKAAVSTWSTPPNNPWGGNHTAVIIIRRCQQRKGEGEKKQIYLGLSLGESAVCIRIELCVRLQLSERYTERRKNTLSTRQKNNKPKCTPLRLTHSHSCTYNPSASSSSSRKASAILALSFSALITAFCSEITASKEQTRLRNTWTSWGQRRSLWLMFKWFHWNSSA